MVNTIDMRLAEITNDNTKKHVDGLAKTIPFEKKYEQMKANKAARTDDYLEKRIRYIEAQRSNK